MGVQRFPRLCIGEGGDEWTLEAHPPHAGHEGPITLIYKPASSRRERRIALNAEAANLLAGMLVGAAGVANPSLTEQMAGHVEGAVQRTKGAAHE